MNCGTKTYYYRLGAAWGWRILDKLSDAQLAHGQAARKRQAEQAVKKKHQELRKKLGHE